MAKRTLSNSSVSDGDAAATANSDGAGSPSQHTSKYASVEPEAIQPASSSFAMRCLLPPHKPLDFSNAVEHEAHYRLSHTNRCVGCDKNFPTSHFLELHIIEHHDPIAASKRDAGEKTFDCFVEGCDKVCRDWKKRRSHLVDKHGFPKNYDFLVVDHGIDGRRSMLRPGVDDQGHRKSSRERGRSESSGSETTHTTEPASISGRQTVPGRVDKNSLRDMQTNESDDPQITLDNGHTTSLADLTSSMSALKMIPRSITFGKRKGRSGFAKS